MKNEKSDNEITILVVVDDEQPQAQSRWASYTRGQLHIERSKYTKLKEMHVHYGNFPAAAEARDKADEIRNELRRRNGGRRNRWKYKQKR